MPRLGEPDGTPVRFCSIHAYTWRRNFKPPFSVTDR